MDSTRRAAVVAGVFFLITEVAAIIGRLLYGPLLGNADYVYGAHGIPIVFDEVTHRRKTGSTHTCRKGIPMSAAGRTLGSCPTCLTSPPPSNGS
jgi:hypothetical protein